MQRNPPGCPTALRGVDLFPRIKSFIQAFKRRQGWAYELIEPRLPWSWRGFLNCLDDDTLVPVVGAGITGFRCMPIPGSYDHARRRALSVLQFPLLAGAPVPIWNFVVFRADNSAVRLYTHGG